MSDFTIDKTIKDIVGVSFMNDQYRLVDLLKIIFSCCVVCIHTGIATDSILTPLVLRLAVPYFMVASGFFLGLKIYKDKTIKIREVVIPYIKKLGFKLLLFELINIVLIALTDYVNGSLSYSFFLRIIRSVLFYPYGAMWYVQAVIIGIVFIVPFIKHNQMFAALVLGLFLYCFATICNRYYFVVQGSIIGDVIEKMVFYVKSIRNGLFLGVFYLSIGFLISKYKAIIMEKRKSVLLLLLVSYLIYISEVMLIKPYEGIDDNSLYISHTFLIPALFSFSIQYNPPIEQSVFLRKCSTSFYFLHYPIIWFLNLVSLVVNGSVLSKGVLTVLVFILLCVEVCIIYKVKGKLYRIIT